MLQLFGAYQYVESEVLIFSSNANVFKWLYITMDDGLPWGKVTFYSQKVNSKSLGLLKANFSNQYILHMFFKQLVSFI